MELGGLDEDELNSYLTSNKYLTQTTADSNYLKLTGGTIEGTLQIKRSASVIKYLDAEGESYGWLGFNAVDTPVMYTSTASRSIKLLHAENYNTYAPKLDGTGAKGVWGIDISGEASKVKCTAGTADTYRPVVVTVPDAATQNLYYGEKVLANYATGDLKVSSTTVDGIRIYKSSTGVLRIDGDVVLSGALTMYGTDSVNTSTIMDGVVVDGTTIMNDGKKLYLNPNLELGGLDEDELNSYLTSNKYLTQTTGDARYVTAIGTSGNYLTYTKNGATQNVTVPYATNADKLDGIHSTGFYKSNAGRLESDELETFVNRDSGGYSVTYRSASTGGVSYSGMFSVLKSGAGSVQAIELIANNYTLKQGALQVRLNVDGTRYSATKTIAFSDGNVATADTASKLSTVSKTAWGQTYWTSGGVPTSISGNMTGVGSITMNGSINYNDYTIFRYSASTGDGGVSTGASLLGSPSLATTIRSSGNDLYHWNEANSTKYLIFDTNNFTNYTNKALTKKNSGTNLLTDGDKYIGAQNYLIGTYTYASSVTNGVKYRCTLCGKLGDNNTHIAAYWDGGLGNNTTISGLSSTEERTISFTATITNKQKLSFYQLPNGKFGSYIKWCKLEVEEDVTGDTSTYLYNIDRIDFANDSNSHNFGIDRNGTVYGYNAGVLKLRRGKSSGGSYVQYEANNQAVYGWRAGANDIYNFCWWYYDTSSGTDICKMKLTSAGVLSSDYWMLNNKVTNPYLKLTHTYNSTTYTHYLQGYQGYLYLGAGSSKSLRIDGSGNCLAIGGITMYSDIRKKTKLKDVELTLKQVAEAPLIEHYYNSDEKKTTHVGSIAQYWAGLNDWFCKKDDDGYYTMEIQNVALASAISVARELSRFESDTDRRIRLLEEENKRLKKEIERLKTA